MANQGSSKFAESHRLLEKSCRYLAGGVSSHVRLSCKPFPLFFRSAAGSQLIDADGNALIDYTLAWGPLILGHSHPAVVTAVRNQLEKFHTLGAQHELEISVAEKICQMVPSADLVAFSNTGSEAVQVALRLARAFTQRSKIIRFEGHYHGWLDDMLVGYRPSHLFGTKQGGDPSESARENAEGRICALPWNDLDRLERTLREQGSEIAAIITEPILCNCNYLLPSPGYLEGMRELATRYGVILIFDEVITGFRVARGGAQELFRITPDLSILGKAIAGGFTLSAVAGKQEIMELIANRSVIHAGTFNGHPISLAAAQATLDVLDADSGAVLTGIRKTGESLMRGIQELARGAGIPLLVNGVGGAFHLTFTGREKMSDYRDTQDSDLQARDHFLEAMLKAGIYLLPDGRWYVSGAHTKADVDATLEAVREVFQSHRNEPIPKGLSAH
jgi:glutamate-1-semialdehyde 2,1-aminomutase